MNTGLSDLPEDVDRRTPRTAMESFYRAAAAEDWASAAHLLDLSDLAVADQAVQGPELAEKLFQLLERKAVIDWSTFLQRPDALQARGGQNEAQAGEPRRSLLLRDVSLDPVPSAIRLNRVKVGENGTPFWIFPRETVADIDAMYEVYGPKAFEKNLPSVLRQDAFLGLMWWEILGLPLLLIAAGGLGYFVRATLKWANRTFAASGLPSRILHAISTPLVVASVAILISSITRNLFVFSGQIDLFIGPLIAIGFVAAVLMLIVNVVEAIMDTLIAPGDDVDLTAPDRAESRVAATRLNAAKRILVILVVLIGSGIVLSTADIFRSIGLSLLASAGALTLVMGFAARDVLGNIMASLQIALNQSARVGDRIIFEGELCHVERIHMTFVQLRHWEGTRMIVPVKEFVSKAFRNWSLVEPEMTRVIKLKLSPRADVERLRQAFFDVVREVKETEIGQNLGDLDDMAVNVAGQDTLGIDVWFNVPCADANTSFEVACEVRERLLVRANEVFDKDEALYPQSAVADAA
ncbi:mechanosensitive ion channel family protein [Jannaschia donghaensis]|uniref:mechanosensitive ion channel family protein n=1 Tax=Jannaschia donghaensis TaxID=420998 RepID=UPI0016513426|nr:mechanosensitive ion channel domain-containing protein [Jannaschia donghaensis]